MRNFMLPKKAILEFIVIYRRSYGVELSFEQAQDRAERLVKLYRSVYSDLPFGKIELPQKANHEKR